MDSAVDGVPMNDNDLIALGDCGTPHRKLAAERGWTIGKFAGKLMRARVRATQEPKPLPKILTFDIETSLMRFYGWRTGEQYVNASNIIDDWFVHCWAATWLGEDKIMHAVQTPTEAKRKDDKRVVTKMWNLINEADIVVGHNIKQFDLKKLNWRWIVHGLNEPMPYKPVDTLQIARSKFGASSRALDYLTKELKIPNKTETNYALWKSCYAGNGKALKEMDIYCQNDIIINEALYIRLRGWANTHPNLGLYSKTQVCRNCASPNLVPKLKLATTPANVYKTYRCADCGKAGRYKKSEINTEHRKRLVV